MTDITHTEAMRSKFEAWMSKDEDAPLGRMSLLTNSEYSNGETQAAWTAWQAALTEQLQPRTDEAFCERCKGSCEDPEGFFDQSRGPDGDTHDGPCRGCNGSGIAAQPGALDVPADHVPDASNMVPARSLDTPITGWKWMTNPSIDAAVMQEPVKLYVELRECSACTHIGMNDSSETQAACNTCGWIGLEPKEDHCPGCAATGTMTAACPKCGDQYLLIEAKELAATPQPAASVASGGDAVYAPLTGRTPDVPSDPLQGAADWLVSATNATTTDLQRNLSIGYNRASRLHAAACHAATPQRAIPEGEDTARLDWWISKRPETTAGDNGWICLTWWDGENLFCHEGATIRDAIDSGMKVTP